MNESCAICGQEVVIQSAMDWDSYQANPGNFASQYAGLRCSHCNAVYCNKLHQKELNFKIFKGGYRSGTCPRCGASLQDSIVLLGAVQQSTFGTTTSAAPAGYLFGEKAQADFDKHSKRLKTTLILSIIGTVWIFIAALLMSLIGLLFPENAESIMDVFMWVMIIPGLGIYVWPFVIFHAIRKGRAKKELAGLPVPGQARFAYVIDLFRRRGWNVIKGEPSSETCRLQERKKFNILAALLGLAFGLIGFFFYLQEYNKPGAIVEMLLNPDGTVRVTAVSG